MRVNTPTPAYRHHRRHLLGGISYVAALTALMTAPQAMAREVTSAETTPIEMMQGTAVNVRSGGSLSVVCDANKPEQQTAIHTVQQGSEINIEDGGTVELREGDCDANTLMPATIAVDDSGDDAVPSAGLITNGGTINGLPGGYAIRIEDGAGGPVTTTDGTGADVTTDFIVSVVNESTGEINGDVYLGAGSNHTLDNAGTLNGTIVGAGRTGLTINNTGTHSAGDADSTAIEILEGSSAADADQRLIGISNQGTLTGQIKLGGGANYQFINSGEMTGGLTVEKGAATNLTFGQIANGGTWTAGSDGVAIRLGDGLGGDEPSTDVAGNPTTIERGFTISNNVGAELFGDVVIGDGGNHEFSSAGDLTGRVIAGDGDNTFNFTGGIAGLATAADFANGPLVDAGAGDDMLALSGATVAPVFSTEDPTAILDGTLFQAGDGDDEAQILRGTMRGATVLLDMGDGNDRVLVAPSTFGEFEFEGDVLGGNGEDTLAVQGFDLDTPFEITGDWAFSGFENFEAPILEVLINLDPAGTFDVAGGTVSTSGTGVLHLAMGWAASTAQQDFATAVGATGTATQLFGASEVTNDAGLIFDRPSFITADGASVLQGETGSMLFSVLGDGTGVTNSGALLLNDPNAPSNGGPARVVLTEGSTLGLSMESKDVMGRDANGRAVPQGTFTVLVAPTISVTDLQVDANGDPIAPLDRDVTEADSTALVDLIGLSDDDPFYKFAYNVITHTDDATNEFTQVQIIATRTPGFAQTIIDTGLTETLGEFGTGLDSVFGNCSDADNNGSDAFCSSLFELGLRPDDEIATGLLQAAPNRMAGGHRAVVSNYGHANDVISNRTALIRTSTVGPRTIRHAGYNVQADEERGMAAGSVWASHHVWVQGWGAFMDQDSTATAAGFQADNYGAVLGYDWRINRTNLIGVYGSYANSSVDGRDIGNDQLDITGYGGGAYYNWFDRRSSAQVIVSGGTTDYEGDRLGLASQAVYRDYTGWYMGFRGSADTSFRSFGKLVMTPSASLQYLLNHEGDYTETGGIGAMSVKSRNGHSMQIRLADRLTLPVRMGNALGLPYFQLSWTHEFIDNAPESKGQFVNSTNVVAVNAPEVSIVSDSFAAGVGFDLATRGGTSLSAGYEFTYDEDTTAHTGSLSIRVSF